jgi:hypothetical protein
MKTSFANSNPHRRLLEAAVNGVAVNVYRDLDIAAASSGTGAFSAKSPHGATLCLDTQRIAE